MSSEIDCWATSEARPSYPYKPQQLSEEEVTSKVQEAIQETGASSMQDIGKVMGVLKSSLAGSADMGMVSKIVKEELS